MNAAEKTDAPEIDILDLIHQLETLEAVENEIDLAYYAACSDNPSLEPIANCLERTATKLKRTREALDGHLKDVKRVHAARKVQ